jgi:mono/diheme cytochrome c family protein
MKSLLAVVLPVMVLLISCAGGDKKPTPSASSDKPAVDGAKIYKINCELCHGPDGKLKANGSKDLTISEMDLDMRIVQISKGKGLMMPYEKILSLAEIKAVAEYTMTLK